MAHGIDSQFVDGSMPTASALSSAITGALAESGVSKGDVSYVSAHGIKFSKVLYVVTVHSKYSRALTFENLCQGLVCLHTMLLSIPNVLLMCQGLVCLHTTVLLMCC